MLVKNAENNVPGYRKNEFDSATKNLSAYLYVRAQKSAYDFLSSNLGTPSIWTIKSFIDQHNQVHREGELIFDKLVDWLKENNFPLVVIISEDGTKIVPKVEYCSTTNALTGLVAPNDDTTGFPKTDFFKVLTAKDIANFIANFPVANYVQVIIASPVVTNAPSFVLGYFGTDNTFLTTDVMTRNIYIKKELEKRGVRVVGNSSDGDSRALNSLKIFMEFGKIFTRGSLHMLANPDSENIGNIDALHKAKGLVDRVYTLGIMMRMGNRVPSVNHLIMIYKTKNKIDHDMTVKNLDVTNHMDYE